MDRNDRATGRHSEDLTPAKNIYTLRAQLGVAMSNATDLSGGDPYTNFGVFVFEPNDTSNPEISQQNEI